MNTNRYKSQRSLSAQRLQAAPRMPQWVIDAYNVLKLKGGSLQRWDPECATFKIRTDSDGTLYIPSSGSNIQRSDFLLKLEKFIKDHDDIHLDFMISVEKGLLCYQMSVVDEE